MTDQLQPDDFPQIIIDEAERLAEEYMTTVLKDNDEGTLGYVRDFVQLMSPMFEGTINLEDSVQIAVHVMTYIKVYEKCFVKGYAYADKKHQAIQALKNTFDS